MRACLCHHRFVTFSLSRISLVIQLCLFVISQGMIGGDVIRLFTFLGESGGKVLPSTRSGPLQRKGNLCVGTLATRHSENSSVQEIEAGLEEMLLCRS